MRLETSVCGTCIALVLLLACTEVPGGESASDLVELTGITNPDGLYLHGELLYVVEDGAEIRVYDTKEYHYIRSFGSRGEDVGQFELRKGHAVSLFFSNEQILVNSDGKLSWFSLEGEFIREVATARRTARYRPLGSDRLIFRGHARDGDTAYFTYVICDTALVDICELYRHPNDFQKQGPTLDAFAVSWEFYVVGDHVFLHDRAKGQAIDIYDRTGRLLRACEDAYEPIPVNQSIIDDVHERYRTNPYTRDNYDALFKDALRFPDFLPAIRSWMVADDKIYIFSFKTRGDLFQLKTYDIQCRYLGEEYVRLNRKNSSIDSVAPYAIGGGRLHQFVEIDDGCWRLQVTRLE